MPDRPFEKSSLNTVKRLPKRGHYDQETVYSIVDAHFICHIAWEVNGQPFIIPTGYGRKDDILYIHGSSKSRMLDDLKDGRPISLVVTHIDGLVLARSAFHHSVNYRSAVIFGNAREVKGDEKMEALKIISDNILRGRWEEVRLPNELEMKATLVLAIDITTASAKIRTGPPSDDEPDYDLPIWAGILPSRLVFDDPETDPNAKNEYPFPISIQTRMSPG